MLSRSFFYPNFSQGPFPKIAGKSPDFVLFEVHLGLTQVDIVKYGKFEVARTRGFYF